MALQDRERSDSREIGSSSMVSEITEPRYPTERQPAIRIIMMPRDTNPLGTIFGGVILSHIDMSAAS